MDNKVRLDQYLWAIRIFKTRGLAKDAIDEGKVRFAGELTKPSKSVHVGETYNIRSSEKRQSIQVKGVISKRVAYSLAIENYYDVSTPEELEFAKNRMTSSFYTGKRLSNVGRPTKKNARDLSDFFNDPDDKPSDALNNNELQSEETHVEEDQPDTLNKD
jgi:ribosome-associated heat shock protein Hsp15